MNSHPIIDVHHHVIGKNNPNFANLPKWNIEIDAEENNRLGIDGCLLSLPVSSTPDQTRTINDFLAGYAAYDPKRYGILACLPAGDIDCALREIHYAYETLNADGFCLPTNAGGVYVGDDRMDEILAELNRRSSVVLLHPVKPFNEAPSLNVTDPSILEFPFETTRAVIDLVYRNKTTKYPDIKWIISHAGGTIPYLAYRLSMVAEESKAINISCIDVLSAIRNLYFDLALSTSEGVFFCLKNLAGPSQIVFGTDAPLRPGSGVEGSITVFNNTFIFTENEKKDITMNTSAGLFPRFAHLAY